MALALIALTWGVAALSRMGAEFLVAMYPPHLLYGSVLWIAASLAWLGMLGPRLREDD
ncbi:MAG: hypothetical protein ACLFU2_03180 [Opitutales bacterium]